jgi:gliding-associated putative ABC transporter substrate-binding component GldG
MKKERLLFSITTVVIFIAIMVFVNLISQYVFLRFDCTAGNIYSITKPTKKILRSLEDRILIKVYFTKELPPEYANNYKYLEDLLSEYKTYSHGKIKVEYVDPSASKDRQNEAYQLGIPPIKFQQISRDKYEVKEGFMGLAFLYNDKTEVIPVVKSIEGLEYDITSRLKKLIGKELKTIGFTSGHRETQLTPEFNEFVYRNYNSRQIDLKTMMVPQDISCLIVIGPKDKMGDKELFAIEQFVMTGKPIGLLIDSFDINYQYFYAQKIEPGFDAFLQYYGIRILPELVIDALNQRIAIQSQQGGYQVQNIVNYPMIPMVQDLNKNTALVRNLDGVGLPFVSPIEVGTKEDLKIDIVAKSSKNSWVKSNMMSVNPYNTNFNLAKEDKLGPFNLAVIIEPKPQVTWKAYYADKMTKEITDYCKGAIPVTETQTLGRIFVCSTAQFATRDPGFLMNILDWLAQDEDLISIRAKATETRALRQVPYGLAVIIKILDIFLVPALVIFAGFVLYKRRKIVRKQKEEFYTAGI